MGTEIEVVERIARVLWESDQESVERSFDDLQCGPVLDTLYDIAEKIIEIPQIAAALKAHPNTGRV